MQLISIMNLRNLSFPQYILIKYKFDGPWPKKGLNIEVHASFLQTTYPNQIMTFTPKKAYGFTLFGYLANFQVNTCKSTWVCRLYPSPLQDVDLSGAQHAAEDGKAAEERGVGRSFWSNLVCFWVFRHQSSKSIVVSYWHGSGPNKVLWRLCSWFPSWTSETFPSLNISWLSTSLMVVSMFKKVKKHKILAGRWSIGGSYRAFAWCCGCGTSFRGPLNMCKTLVMAKKGIEHRSARIILANNITKPNHDLYTKKSFMVLLFLVTLPTSKLTRASQHGFTGCAHHRCRMLIYPGHNLQQKMGKLLRRGVWGDLFGVFLSNME